MSDVIRIADPDFAHVRDEEREPFAEPPRAAAPASDEDAPFGHGEHGGPGRPSLLLRLTAGVAVAGAVALTLLLAAGIGGAGDLVTALTGGLLGTWWGLLLGLVLPSAAASVWFYETWRRRPAGVRNEGTFFRGMSSRGLGAWLVGVALTAFYVALYWYPQVIHDAGLVALVDPLARWMTGYPADQWFVYTVLYSAVVAVFGVRMAMRYRHSRYHLVRTASVVVAQVGLAFVLPKLLVRMQQPEFYPTYFWPLKRDVLLPGDYGMNWTATEAAGQVGIWMLVFAGAMTFLATPVLTWFYGKRWYCSWVCGCGGLAETLGDPWRHLSDKSTRAWWIEKILVHAVLVWIVLLTGALWLNHVQGGALLGGAGPGLERTYGFVIGSLFAGVAGVGFYPLLGTRVWCRFGCPMAAILGILQRYLSRFRITTNGGQCISCGNCSTYCEMGIDVKAYAQRGENIVRASCVGCGVCAEVCPRGVLKLENGPSVLGEERRSS